MENTLEISQLPTYKLIWQETLSWSPTENDYRLFQQLYGEILIVNQYLNLTRITEPIDFWEKTSLGFFSRNYSFNQ